MKKKAVKWIAIVLVVLLVVAGVGMFIFSRMMRTARRPFRWKVAHI